jgi:molybdopterin synthase catalytic subunit
VSTATVHARVTGEALSLDALAERVVRPSAGAIVTFQGTTRDVERLDYEAYREMAEQRIEAIVGNAIERHRLEAAAAEHRVGTVPRGEASVIVAVSAAHRAEAPIWKKEIIGKAEGGEARWVEGSRAGGDGERA